MKIPTLTLATLLVALSTVANQNARQGWSGRLEQKSMDQYARMLTRMTTINGGLLSSIDRFSQASYFPPDPKAGMDPLPEETMAEGFMIKWNRETGKARGIWWRTTFGGEQIIELIPQAGLQMEPIGISYFSGLMVTEQGRNKTLGGFAFEAQNLEPDTVTATITADWDANEMLMAHRTTHGGSLVFGQTRVFAIVPERDEWAMASGVNAEVE